MAVVPQRESSMSKISLPIRLLAGFIALLQATITPPSVIQMVTTRLEHKYVKEKDFEEQQRWRLFRKRNKKKK